MISIKKEHCIYAMGPKNKAAVKVPAGSIMEFETADCFGDQITSKKDSIGDLDWNTINPATGPVFVRGAQPGDALKVVIKNIEIADKGLIAALPQAGIFGEHIESSEIKIVAIKKGQVVFNDHIKFDAAPMVGVIGVAPEREDIACGTPGSHGGNMDNKLIKAGAALYLPVAVPGGLLALGDVHACMGDGEVMISGLEVSAKVQVSVDVIKEAHISNPILENEELFCTIASASDIMQAIKIAAGDMQKIVMKQLQLSFNEAGMLISTVGNAEICQVVDPLVTARFTMPKLVLPNISGLSSELDKQR